MDTNMNPAETSEGGGGAETTFHISPGEGGWSVKSDARDGRVTTYPNKISAVSAARQMVKNLGAGHVVVHRRDGRIESEEETDRGGSYRTRPNPLARAQPFFPGFERSPAPWGGSEDQILQELAAKTGEDLHEVIGKALALYKAAMEAVEQGKAVGIASDPSHLESEFVGF